MGIDMKTIRTIIGTLSAVLLTFALVAWFSVRRSAAFIQRTIYQGFDQTFVVALVMGCAFLLITIILSVAIASTDDEDDEEEDEESFRPRHQTRPPAGRGEQPYRRVSRSMEQSRSLEQRARREEDDFSRPRTRTEAKPARRAGADAPVQRKRERIAEEPEQVALSRREASVKKAKKAPKPPVEKDEAEAYEAEAEPAPRASKAEPAAPAVEAAETAEEASDIASSAAGTADTAGAAETAAEAGTAAAAKTAAVTAAATGAKMALSTKIIAAVLAVALIGGGGFAVSKAINKTPQEPPAAE